jgi:hypothetical protein
MKWGLPSHSVLWVKISQPVSVTSRVCSNWADRKPSWKLHDIVYINGTFSYVSSKFYYIMMTSCNASQSCMQHRHHSPTVTLLTYLCYSSPVVGPSDVPPRPLTDHGLYREGVTRSHHTYCLVLWRERKREKNQIHTTGKKKVIVTH